MKCIKCQRVDDRMGLLTSTGEGSVRCRHCDRMTPYKPLNDNTVGPSCDIRERGFRFGTHAVLCTVCMNDAERGICTRPEWTAYLRAVYAKDAESDVANSALLREWLDKWLLEPWKPAGATP